MRYRPSMTSPGSSSFVAGIGTLSSALAADIERPRPSKNANSDPTNLDHKYAWYGRDLMAGL
jgi:hypothetical protein